jgi:hypothetical protein
LRDKSTLESCAISTLRERNPPIRNDP